MNRPCILKVQKNLSIPWFEQIEKEVLLPGEDGSQIYYSIKPSDYVTALAKTKDDKFILLRQYRPAVEDYTYELPSGHIEKGETPGQAVIREVEEETSCRAGKVTFLGELIPDTGRLENRLWAFYIDDLEVGEILSPDENDGIEICPVSHDDFFKMINDGKINHALDLSVIALSIFKKHLKLIN
ncbi:MAG: NUDIX hydrolase [Nitrospirota bacterium]